MLDLSSATLPVLYHVYEKENLKCRSVWTVFAHCMWYEVWLPFSDTARTAIVHMPLRPLEPGPGEYGKYKDVPEHSYPVEGLWLLVFHPCVIDILIKWEYRLCVCMLLPCNKLLYCWSLQKIKNQLTPSEGNSHSTGTEINLVWNPDIQ